VRPLWRETSTRQQNDGLEKRSHRPHVHLRVRGSNMGLRTSVGRLSSRPLSFKPDSPAVSLGSPLVCPGFAGCQGAGRPAPAQGAPTLCGPPVNWKPWAIGSHGRGALDVVVYNCV
jgi:hypothetical protein